MTMPLEKTGTAANETSSSSTTAEQKIQDGSRQEATHPSVQRPQSVIGEILFIALICSSQLLAQAGLAMSIVPQHLIAHSFGIENNPAKVSWFSAGYSLTAGTCILIAGRLGDVFGHKRFFVGGFFWFSLWSLLAGVAVYSTPEFFAFCRAMQGIGPALMLPNAMAIIGLCYNPGLRQNLMFSLFGATAPSGFLLGAIFSSLLSEFAWWPWSYWIMCFVCLFLALASIFIMPGAPPQSSSGSGRENASIWQRIDIFGSIAGVTSLALFDFAWNQGPVVGWSTPYTYIILIISILAFIVFVLIEKRVRYPLIPFGVLKIDALFTLACVSAGWSSFGIFVYYMWNFLVVLRGQSTLYSSAQFVPISICGILAALTTGLALSHFRASTVMVLAMLAFLASGIIFATVPVHQTYWAQTFVGIVLFPWGMDMSFPAATIVMSRAMPREHQGLAGSLVSTFVNYSISIGLGVAGTVEAQVDDNGKNTLQGYRGAFYLGVGLAGLGVVVALVFCLVERIRGEAPDEASDERQKVTS